MHSCHTTALLRSDWETVRKRNIPSGSVSANIADSHLRVKGGVAQGKYVHRLLGSGT